MADAGPIIDDLATESDELDELVAPLRGVDWATPTPAVGWTIAHQIGHLLWTDRIAFTSVVDEGAFGAVLAAAAADPGGFVDAGAEEQARRKPAELLDDWRHTRRRLQHALRGMDPARKLAWFGPPMTAASMATARLMETWAHGVDVADALGVGKPPTGRLHSIAHLGVRTRDYAFTVHGRTPPTEPFRVELLAPDGASWGWGPADAVQRVTGPAEDFCYLVTQRRPPASLDLEATGEDAKTWLTIAQAFAGPPGPGRQLG